MCLVVKKRPKASVIGCREVQDKNWICNSLDLYRPLRGPSDHMLVPSSFWVGLPSGHIKPKKC
jgi:hypothetical protein